eukprot:Tbor_TRINITY_DN4671_c0_g1::TRINITY_DN4671_c0_g1_i1::g.14900::m.14900
MSLGQRKQATGGGGRYSSTVEKGPSAWKQEWSGFITGIKMTNEGKSIKLPTCMDHEKERQSNYAYLFSTPAERKAERERMKKEADMKAKDQARRNRMAGVAEFDGDSRSKMARELEKAQVTGVSLQGLNRKQKRTVLRLTENNEEEEVPDNNLKKSGGGIKVHELMDLSKAWYQQCPYPLDEISEKLVIKKALKHAKQLNFKYNYMTVHPSWMAARARKRLIEHKTVPQGESIHFDDDGNVVLDRFSCKEVNPCDGSANTYVATSAAVSHCEKDNVYIPYYVSPYYNHYKPYGVDEVQLMVSSAVLKTQQHHFKPEVVEEAKPAEKGNNINKNKSKKDQKSKKSANSNEKREVDDGFSKGNSDVSLDENDMSAEVDIENDEGTSGEEEEEENGEEKDNEKSEKEEGCTDDGHNESDDSQSNGGHSDDSNPVPSKKPKNKKKINQPPPIPDNVDEKIKTKAKNIAASLARRLKKKGAKKVNIKRLQDNELRKLLGLIGPFKKKTSTGKHTCDDDNTNCDVGDEHTKKKKSAGRKTSLLKAGKPLPQHFKTKRGGRLLKETGGKYVHPARAAIIRKRLRHSSSS